MRFRIWGEVALRLRSLGFEAVYAFWVWGVGALKVRRAWGFSCLFTRSILNNENLLELHRQTLNARIMWGKMTLVFLSWFWGNNSHTGKHSRSLIYQFHCYSSFFAQSWDDNIAFAFWTMEPSYCITYGLSTLCGKKSHIF